MAGDVFVDDIGRHRFDASGFSRLDVVDSRAAMVDHDTVEAELGLDDVERRLRRVVCDRPAGSDQFGFEVVMSPTMHPLAEVDLAAIVSIASAEVPSDLEWARNALESCLRGDVGSRPGSYDWSSAA